MVLTPANGRDYESKAQVLDDFNAGEPFTLQPDGRQITRAQVEAEGTTSVQIRYHHHGRLVIFDLVDGEWVLP